MQAIRLTRHSRLPRSGPTVHLHRGLAAAAASGPHASTTTASASSGSAQSVIPLSNVEAQWEAMSQDEQLTVHQQLEEVQKKDWKTLSMDEKKAAYYVAFGPHGPRTPIDGPGAGYKIFLGVAGLIGAASAVFYALRLAAPSPPRTITKEWEEAANQRAIEAKINPITGISSEGYKGKGFVTHSK